MLVAMSDLHLTDGRTAVNPHANVFDIVQDHVVESAPDKDAKEIRILLLGDIFDLVRTDHWHRNVMPQQRPWGGSRLDPDTGMNADLDLLPQFQAILGEILQTAAAQSLVRVIQEIGQRTGMEPQITYVVGNHDRVLNNFPALRTTLVNAFKPARLEFTNIYENPAYGIHAEHGQAWDADCHGWEFLRKVLRKGARVGRFDDAAFNVMAIGEVVTAELMGGLIYYARERLRGDPQAGPFLERLQNVNNLRPMTDVLYWLAWLAGKKPNAQPYWRECSDALRHALDGLLDCTFAQRWDALKPDLLVSGDLTDLLGHLRTALRLHPAPDTIGKVLPVADKYNAVKKLLTGGKDEYVDGAREEAGKLPAEIQYLVFGHTHQAAQDCFSVDPDGRVRLYVNTGTFLPLITRAGDGSFFESSRMSFVTFYRGDEDNDDRANDLPTMEVWDGLKRKAYRCTPAAPPAAGRPVRPGKPAATATTRKRRR